MRLIDADEVLKNINNLQSGEYDQFDKETVWLIGINDAMSCLKTAPTVDAVEVVRCKDCCHHEDEEPGMVYCPHIVGSWVENDFFCGYGERKTE